MVFRHAGRTYANAQMRAYRTADLDVVIVTAPPDHRLVFVVQFEGARLADAEEIARLAERYNIEELKPMPAAASAA